MGIHQISRNRMIHTTNTEQALKPGQIIQGKILKLYPNNKAQIQLGSQTMIAQLEASLAVGERYHFQVEATDDLIHLKVIGEHLKKRSQTNMTELLQTLGLKVSKANVNFVQSLINEKIPFDRTNLMRAFSLLEGAKNSPESHQVLKEMMIQKTTITDNVFQALLTKNTAKLSDQIKAVLQELNQHRNPSALQQSLINRLSQMTELPLTNQMKMITQIIAEVNVNHQQTFDTLKVSGLIDRNLEFSTWKSQWQLFSKQHQMLTNHTSNHQLLQENIPFPINPIMIEQTLNKIMNSQVELRESSQELVHNWARQINESVLTIKPLSERNFEQFRHYITEKIMPLLSAGQQELIRGNLQNNPIQLRQILTVIQQYASEQIYTNMGQILTTVTEQDTFSMLTPKDQFLGQVRQMLLFSGLTDENLLVQDSITQQQSQTVKSMLIQMLQQGDHVSNERVQQLLHHINGLQLQSVQEIGNFIQASLVVPGEKLGLNNDIYVEFESKKSGDDKINPDFCRILFYLDLANLRETIIDMQIQKRFVTVTIFNDHQNMKLQANQLQPFLKEGLESLNYQLSNIMIKPVQEQNVNRKKSLKQSSQNSYEGIEFRI